jgi:hypothetical protein
MTSPQIEFGRLLPHEASFMVKKTGKKNGKKSAPGSAKAAAAVSAIPVTQTPSAPPRAPSGDDVSARAHAIWISRGKPTPGTPLEDWLQAEREILGAKKS